VSGHALPCVFRSDAARVVVVAGLEIRLQRPV
jgi:hypothetical protein